MKLHLPDRWQQRARTLLTFGSAQAAVQIVAATSGFLLVRWLDKTEFAAYAVATSAQVMLMTITDSGITSGLNSLGGARWNDPARLGGVLTAALRLRTRLALIMVPLVLGFCLVYLFRSGYAALPGLALALVTGLSIWGFIASGLYAVPLRLAGRYHQAQVTELTAGLIRLGLTCLAALVWLNAVVAMVTTALTVALQGIWMRRRCAQVAQLGVAPAPEDARHLTRLVRKQLFSGIFFALQGQITIWLMTLSGAVEQVAEVGALSRLGFLFTFVGSFITGLAAPAFARCTALEKLTRLSLLAYAGYALFATVLLSLGGFAPGWILWLLGRQYTGLETELLWALSASVVWGFTGVSYALASSRGWIWHAWLIPPLTILVQAVGLLFVSVQTVSGVLVLGLLGAVPTFGVAVAMVIKGMRRSFRSGTIAPAAS